jgi:DNA-directed RNA polymerase beta' subunit
MWFQNHSKWRVFMCLKSFGMGLSLRLGDSKQFLSVHVIVKLFRNMIEDDMKALGLDIVHARPEWFLVQVLPVVPLHV